MRITDRAACSEILRVLSTARIRSDYKLAATGSLTVQFAGGSTGLIEFLPSNDKRAFNIRWDRHMYELSDDQFIKSFQASGIDAQETTKWYQ